MSHQVEKMVFTGKKPWWYGNASQKDAVGIDLGADTITSKQAIEAADLDWLVEKRQAGFQTITPHPVYPVEAWNKAEGECFLIRSSDNSVLGRCTDEYKPFQNTEAFEFLDALVKEGQLLYHTAGSLEGGKCVFILAQTPITWQVIRRSGKTNTHHAFLNCLLGHSGKAGINLQPTEIRVECANTQRWADDTAGREHLNFSIPHRGDIKAKLELAALAIKTLSQQSDGRRQVLQALAQQAMNTDEFIDFATSVFLGLDGEPGVVEEAVAKFYEDATPRSKTILENKVAAVAANFESGQGNEGDSSYDALQAFSEYFDHFDLSHIQDKIEQGKRAAKAVQSSWIGAGAERKSLVYKRLNERLLH